MVSYKKWNLLYVYPPTAYTWAVIKTVKQRDREAIVHYPWSILRTIAAVIGLIFLISIFAGGGSSNNSSSAFITPAGVTHTATYVSCCARRVGQADKRDLGATLRTSRQSPAGATLELRARQWRQPGQT